MAPETILEALLRQRTFRHILFSMGFETIRESGNSVLLGNKKNGVRLVIGRFDHMDSPVSVYALPFAGVLSKTETLVYLLGDLGFGSFETTFNFEPGVAGSLDEREFTFDAPIKEADAHRICLGLKPVGNVPGAPDLDVSTFEKKPYGRVVFLRDGKLSFLLFRDGNVNVGIQPVGFEGGVCTETYEGAAEGYFTNAPVAPGRAVVFFSFGSFLGQGGYSRFVDEKVFVFPLGSRSDLFRDVVDQCRRNGLELFLFVPNGFDGGGDNYLRFILYHIKHNNPDIHYIDYAQGKLIGRVSYSYDRQRFRPAHFGQCYNDLQERCIGFLEGFGLSENILERFVPRAKDRIGETDYLCQIDFYLKEPLFAYMVEYFYKAFSVSPYKSIKG